ncbi:MAG: hypothetical protein ACRYG2_35185, partial [Janthinobacterium lividum]
QGRFSVAEDDEARWLAGEAPSPVTAVDREDELALVRATREVTPDEEADDEGDAHAADTRELVRAIAEELGGVLETAPPAELSAEELAELAADDPESDDARGSARADEPAPAKDPTGDEPTVVSRRDEAAEPTIAVVRHLTRLTVEVDSVEVGGDAGDARATSPTDEDEARSALDTLYDMLGGYTEESPRLYAGLSDAAAVPVVDEHEFEPPAAVLVPVEPDPETPDPETPDPETPEPDVDDAAPELGQADDVTPQEAPTDEPEPLIPSPGASRKPGRRKRASVPSWDEIMFGGPKPG